ETGVPVVERLVVARYLSPARHGEQPAPDGDIQLLPIDPRGEQVTLYLRRGLNHVDCWKRPAWSRPDAAGARQSVTEHLVHLLMQAPEFVEERILKTR